MPKFGEVMHVHADLKEENNSLMEERIKPTRPSRTEVIAYVEKNPGTDARTVSRQLRPNLATTALTHAMDRTVASILFGIVNKKVDAPLKRLKQDEIYRYYPVSYKLSTDEKMPTLGSIPKPYVPSFTNIDTIPSLLNVSSPLTHLEWLEKAIVDYWATDEYIDPLRKFYKFVKEREGK